MTDWAKRLMDPVPEETKRLCCLVNPLRCPDCERPYKFCEEHLPTKYRAEYVNYAKHNLTFSLRCGGCAQKRKVRTRARLKRQRRKLND